MGAGSCTQGWQSFSNLQQGRARGRTQQICGWWRDLVKHKLSTLSKCACDLTTVIAGTIRGRADLAMGRMLDAVGRWDLGARCRHGPCGDEK